MAKSLYPSVPKVILGMDISKSTVDIAVLKPGIQVVSHQITHNSDALRLFLRQLTTDLGCRAKNMLICAEDMGVFANLLLPKHCEKKFRYVWNHLSGLKGRSELPGARMTG